MSGEILEEILTLAKPLIGTFLNKDDDVLVVLKIIEKQKTNIDEQTTNQQYLFYAKGKQVKILNIKEYVEVVLSRFDDFFIRVEVKYDQNSNDLTIQVSSVNPSREEQLLKSLSDFQPGKTLVINPTQKIDDDIIRYKLMLNYRIPIHGIF